jgi:hypothetical protein
MKEQIDKKLLQSLPIDIIIQNILPYTYIKQPINLLLDIRSFYKDFSIIENLYSYNFNYNTLLFDLICFCNHSQIPGYNVTKRFGKLLNRMFIMKEWSYTKCNDFVFVVFTQLCISNIKRYNMNIVLNHYRKIRFLWGLLKPNERTIFITNFLLADYV